MSHHHAHHHQSGIGRAAVLNLVFAICEWTAGFLFNSTALLSDAVHDTGDVLALLISAWVEKVSKKQPTIAYSYGFGRLNLLAAIVNSVLLLVGTVLIVSEAIPRLLEPEPVNSLGMFVMSILGIGVNLWAVIGLKNSKNILNRSVMLHLAEDLLGWIAVFVTSIVIYFTGWYILDPLASIGIACFIIYNACRNLFQSYQLVMMKTSNLEERSHLAEAIEQLPEVIGLYDLHYWSLDGEHQILTAKVLVTEKADRIQLRQTIHQLCQPLHIACSTIEFVINNDSHQDIDTL